MEIKKINKLLLGIFLLHMVSVALLTVFPEVLEIGIILNLSLGEIILFVPTLVYLLLWKKNGESLKERLHFNNVKPSTFLYVLFYAWLCMPITTLLNAISMLYVDNTVASMSGAMLEIPFLIMLFLMAITPAFCEEIVFRGVVYGGYRKDGNKFFAVILSGFMFGIMHMNLNQALYAFVLGIFLALLFEATDCIVTTMLFHFIYNAQSCCLMYMMEAIVPGIFADVASEAVAPEQLYMMIAAYLVIAAICTPLAICMLYKIAKNENRVEQLKETLPKKREGKAKIVTVSYILATIVAVGYIIYDIIAMKFLY